VRPGPGLGVDTTLAQEALGPRVLTDGHSQNRTDAKTEREEEEESSGGRVRRAEGR